MKYGLFSGPLGGAVGWFPDTAHLIDEGGEGENTYVLLRTSCFSGPHSPLSSHAQVPPGLHLWRRRVLHRARRDHYGSACI